MFENFGKVPPEAAKESKKVFIPATTQPVKSIINKNIERYFNTIAGANTLFTIPANYTGYLYSASISTNPNGCFMAILQGATIRFLILDLPANVDNYRDFEKPIKILSGETISSTAVVTARVSFMLVLVNNSQVQEYEQLTF